MNRLGTSCVFLLCIIMLVVRSADAHVHLCFDGQAPAVTVHFENDAEPAEQFTEATLQHHDLDIDVGADLVTKLPKLDLTFLALLFTAFLVVAALLGKPPLAISRAARFHLKPPSYLRPPLRGPPLHSVH